MLRLAKAPVYPDSPPCLCRAFSQRCLRCCVLGSSPRFYPPNKTQFSSFRLSLFFFFFFFFFLQGTPPSWGGFYSLRLPSLQDSVPPDPGM